MPWLPVGQDCGRYIWPVKLCLGQNRTLEGTRGLPSVLQSSREAEGTRAEIIAARLDLLAATELRLEPFRQLRAQVLATLDMQEASRSEPDRRHPDFEGSDDSAQVASSSDDNRPRSGYLGVILDEGSQIVRRDGFADAVNLAEYPMRFHLLAYFVKHRGAYRGYSDLQTVWGSHGRDDVPTDGTIRSTISSLSGSLEPLFLQIKSYRGAR